VRQRQTKCRALQTNFVAGQERLIADGLRPAARLDDEPPQKGGNDACFGRHEEKESTVHPEPPYAGFLSRRFVVNEILGPPTAAAWRTTLIDDAPSRDDHGRSRCHATARATD